MEMQETQNSQTNNENLKKWWDSHLLNSMLTTKEQKLFLCIIGIRLDK